MMQKLMTEFNLFANYTYVSIKIKVCYYNFLIISDFLKTCTFIMNLKYTVLPNNKYIFSIIISKNSVAQPLSPSPCTTPNPNPK